MAYKVIILYQLYMPSYFLGTFTEYPSFKKKMLKSLRNSVQIFKKDREEFPKRCCSFSYTL